MPEHHDGLPYLREALIFLALSGVLLPLLQRYRVNQMLGFLAAGVLLGPFGLWLWVGQLPWLQNFTFLGVEQVAALGKLGVLFLMFSIGLELSAERLCELRRWVFGAGTAQVLLSALAIGFMAAMFGGETEAVIVLGLALSLSSTAVVMQWMTEHHTLDTEVGQANLSILMFQDLAVVPILLLTGMLAAGDIDRWLPLLAGALIKSVLAILLIYLLGRRVIRPLFKLLGREHQPATFVALILLCTLGVAGLTAYAGLSMALGAFLAGLMLAETEFRHEVEVTIEPFKSLLLGLFFFSVGMQTDMRLLLSAPILLPLSVLGLMLIKATVLAPLLRLGGLGWGSAIEGSLIMGQAGEFAFIIAADAAARGLFPQELAQFVLLVVALSMFATPLAARLGHGLGHAWQCKHHDGAPLSKARVAVMKDHVIIVGFGRMGQLIAEVLSAQHVRYVAIDIDLMRSTKRHPLGEPVYFGDVSRPELLHRVHASSASAIVLTMDHPEAALHAASAIRREFSDVPLLARAHDEYHAHALSEAGASTVMPEALEAGLQLSHFVLRAIGIDEARAAEAIRRERDSRLAMAQ